MRSREGREREDVCVFVCKMKKEGGGVQNGGSREKVECTNWSLFFLDEESSHSLQIVAGSLGRFLRAPSGRG